MSRILIAVVYAVLGAILATLSFSLIGMAILFVVSIADAIARSITIDPSQVAALRVIMSFPILIGGFFGFMWGWDNKFADDV
jgi:hypothetical protein